MSTPKSNQNLPRQKPQRAGAQRTIARRRPAAGDSLKSLKLHKNQLFFSVTDVFFTTFFGLFTLNFLQIFTPETSYAETHTDTSSGAYNGTTYSLTTTVSDLNLELKTLPTGNSTYGAQTVNVTTTAPGGYELYVNTSGVLTNTSDSNSTIPSITGTNQALDMNTWGYTTTTPNEDGDTAGGQSIWNTVPSTLTKVDSSTSAVTNKEKTLYYGIKADNTLADGTYTGTITYTTIANDAASDTLLSIEPASGTAGQATPVTITTSLMTTSSGISASDISAKVGNYTCSDIVITSTAPLTFTCKTSASLTEGTYAVTATISKYGKTYTKTSAFTVKAGDLTGAKMQTSNISTLCKNSKETTSTSDVVTYELTDSRDSQKYYIRKFTFNNTAYCMMVENLALASYTELTSSTSNVVATWRLPSSNANNLHPSKGATKQMYDGASPIAASRKRNGAFYDGSYYNWCAATAGTGGCYNTDRDAGTYDICPKHWRLPTNIENSYISNRINSIGINTFFADSAGAVTTPIDSGYYSGGTHIIGEGLWWSSTQLNSEVAYNLRVYKNAMEASNMYKYIGLPVRCLVQAAS